ncbi:efflux RND transporter periplasmic adaptor subunit [Candidatus Laterigemmans baculatus]|uniref:efflux RND transporter periplasmic adaptor subunit n=1 Tax=Candidatus Laterigemmans baculatus TaxID=2770505 RepID=UPI0013DC6EA7|nr:efflux RND transporter periplasmic adaptor subunit [Candidatus Laterigemmans baculatus]
MSAKDKRQSPRRRRWSYVAALIVLVAVPATVAARWGSGGPTVDSELIWHEVRRGDMKVSVIERGNLESQQNIEVYCGVEDVQRDSINGTPIIWIIPNGSSVKKGDLLVEIESTPMREELDEQILETEESRNVAFQAESNYQNQVVQNETAEADARLKVELAKLELAMFQDPDSGTHKLAVDEIERSIEDVNNEILSAQAALELQNDDLRGIETLFRLGYANRNELRRSELSYMQAEGKYAASLNKLRTHQSSLEKTRNYVRRMELLSLEGALQTAERNLEQVIRNNEVKLAQAKSVLNARTESLKKDEERLARYQSQLEACKIYSPADGMIAYASSRNDDIREGAAVRYRQHLLSLPSLNRMQVRTAVHESVLDQLNTGLPAKITVDAFPDRSYDGEVQSIAVLPDQNSWRGSDTKVYETVVTIDTEVSQIKPGMTAVCEIEIESIEDAVLVPIQSLIERDGRTWVMARSGESIVPREVSVGRENDSQVQILRGLEEGDQVALNPAQLADLLPTEPSPEAA